VSIFRLHGREINSIFQLMGYKENDITNSIAWVLSKCGAMLEIFIKNICEIDKIDFENLDICVQEYDKDSGITDIEIKDDRNLYLIIEAKRGWILPRKEQLLKYSKRETFIKSYAKKKLIVTLSECSRDYALHHLEIKNVNEIPITHVSWKDIYEFSTQAYPMSSNHEKRIIRELQTYLKGLITMQNQNSNMVFVVSLSSKKINNCAFSTIDLLEQKNVYFHPMGGNGWPKEAPNYIAFRYQGKLQSIHHIEDYKITTNIHEVVDEMPNEYWNDPHFVYTLGPAIIPSKEVKIGNIYRNGRVWCHLDTLLTCDTISEARDLTKKRTE